MAVNPMKSTGLASIYSISILGMVIIGTVIAMLPTLMVRDQHQNMAFAQTEINLSARLFNAF
jgi:hypothetical protein